MAWPLAHVLSPTGLLVAYCHRFDIQVQSSRVYFVACTIGKPTTPGPQPCPISVWAGSGLCPPHSLFTFHICCCFSFLLSCLSLFSFVFSVSFVIKAIYTKGMFSRFLLDPLVSKNV